MPPLKPNGDHSHFAESKVRFVITAVGETAEVIEEISCPVDGRQTQLAIEAEGSRDAVMNSESNISTREETLQETLVGLFSQFCDPEVRNVPSSVCIEYAIHALL